jgi:tetratricopeptide (TPR) repeat protein
MNAAAIAAVALLLTGVQSHDRPDVLTVHTWIEAVLAHQPGVIDKPLIQVAEEPPTDFDYIRRNIKPVLKKLYEKVEVRNEFLRRAAVFHTDIAMLLPEQAAEFTQDDVTPEVDPYAKKFQLRRQADAVVLSSDSEYLASARDSAHWWMASELLRGIQPHASADPFVARYHRAVIAHFESMLMFGSATHALLRAQRIVPDDPMVLFYDGALHEATASPMVQSIPATAPGIANEWQTPGPDEEWHRAEDDYRKAIAAGAPPETAVHLGRVLGHLEKHAEAATVLEGVMPKLTEPRLQYLAHLFLGVELGALGNLSRAKSTLDEARRLFPTAQAPVVALANAAWQAGNRSEALAALALLEKLPPEANARDDPYWSYYESFAADADTQLEALRNRVGLHGDVK